jgi:uncharacterized protein HemX
MENNLGDAQNVASTNETPASSFPTEASVSSNGSGKKNLYILVALLLLLAGAGSAFMYLQKSPNPKDSSAGFPQRTVQTPKPTQTPTPGINVKDTTDASLDQDAAVLDQNLSNAVSDMDETNKSFNDQPGNLN